MLDILFGALIWLVGDLVVWKAGTRREPSRRDKVLGAVIVIGTIAFLIYLTVRYS